MCHIKLYQLGEDIYLCMVTKPHNDDDNYYDDRIIKNFRSIINLCLSERVSYNLQCTFKILFY